MSKLIELTFNGDAICLNIDYIVTVLAFKEKTRVFLGGQAGSILVDESYEDVKKLIEGTSKLPEMEGGTY